MKKLFTLLLVCFCVTVFAGSFKSSMRLGYGFNPVIEKPTVKRSIMFKSFDNRNSFERDERCGRYRGMGIAGVVVLGVGIAGTTGGVLMIIKGVRGFKNDDGEEIKNFGLIYGGYVVTIIGVAATVAGTVLTAIGFTKARNYCRDDDEEGFYLINRANTIGLAYRF